MSIDKYTFTKLCGAVDNVIMLIPWYSIIMQLALSPSH